MRLSKAQVIRREYARLEREYPQYAHMQKCEIVAARIKGVTLEDVVETIEQEPTE